VSGAKQGAYDGARDGAILGAIGGAVHKAGYQPQGHAATPAKGLLSRVATKLIHNAFVESMPAVHKFLTKAAKAVGLEACFGRGTPILLADGSSKAVESLAKGDVVLSRDDWDEIGAVVGKAVEAVFARSGRVWELRAGGRVIATTGEHPVWVIGPGVDAGAGGAGRGQAGRSERVGGGRHAAEWNAWPRVTACPNKLFGVAERCRTSSQSANVANSPRRHG